MIDKITVLQFVKSQDLCVLSTASKSGKSESAVMACAVKVETSDQASLQILMFTDPAARKMAHLKENNQISVVIGGLKNDPSVQIDGTCQIVSAGQIESVKQYLLSVHPDWQNYFSDQTVFLKITPAWLRYSDFSQNPPAIIEINT